MGQTSRWFQFTSIYSSINGPKKKGKYRMIIFELQTLKNQGEKEYIAWK